MFPYKKATIDCGFAFVNNNEYLNFMAGCFLVGAGFLGDMYTLSPRACGPRASGIHIRQIPCAHVTTITYILEELVRR